MIHSSIHLADRRCRAENVLLIEAARAWCRARASRVPTQPALFACLRCFHCEQLAPVVDSLMLLAEQVCKCRFLTGGKFALSKDEEHPLTLFEEAGREGGDEGTSGLERAFRLALRSTWMVMKLELRQAPL